ncbi:MAG: ATP-binding protein [Coriobacteriia bacterium]
MDDQNSSQELQPDPSRLIEGLRDTGYNFNTAIADIIDNSIAANADFVKISVKMDFAGDVRIIIVDNGSGMDRSGLISAMRYGSPKRPDIGSLGKFGLGLKTASTAFCRSVSVITRDSMTSDILKATWDLDHVTQVGKWELLLPLPSTEELQLFQENIPDSSGTVVIWDKVDRLIKKYQTQSGRHAQGALARLVESLRDHVSMIYQRFLDPADQRARNVTIEIEDQRIESWDPFCEKEPNTVLAANENPTVEFDNAPVSTFSVRAFVLPRKEEFALPDLASKARISNDYQGIYIYRENRLIHFADWLNMFTKEPHGSLLRVEFSFDHTLDDAFHIDVKKSRIILYDELYNWLKEFLGGPRRAADERSRRGMKKQVQQTAKDAHDSSNANISSKERDIRTSEITVVDAAKNEVSVQNRFGSLRIKLPMSEPQKPGQYSVQPVPSIDDGLLWQPLWIEGHLAVQINTGHPYYHKVYIPNYSSGVTIQGMDTLLWALCQAEIDSISSPAMRTQMEELRFVVSKSLRRLVEDLPDPEPGDGNETA